MSLDGLRAWIGEVERKLGMRTRVFLVLSVLAIGGAGAAIYLAIDARDSAVSESDVQALQEQLEARIDEGGATEGPTGVADLQAELEALQAQVEQLSREGGASNKGSREGDGGASGGADATDGNEAKSGGAEAGGASTNGPKGSSSSRLEGLLEQAQKENEQAEQAQSTE